MFLDKLLRVSYQQAVGAADVYSQETLDLGDADVARRIGTGEGISFVIGCDVAAVGGTNNFDVLAVQSASPSLAGHTVMIQRRLDATTLVSGFIFELPIPKDLPTLRYIGLRYELGPADTGTFSAFATPRDQVPAARNYPAGYRQ